MSQTELRQGLAAGLTALAEETRDEPVRRSLHALAASINAGASMPEAIGRLPLAPAHLASLLKAAGERGTYALLLAEVAAGEHRARRLAATASRGMFYPVLLLLACAAMTLAFGWYVLEPLHALLTELELRIPRYVERMHATAIGGGTLVLGGAVAIALLALMVRTLGGRRAWSWFLTHFPIVGLNYHWASVVEWLDLLRLLIQNGRPLSSALREAGAGLRDRYVGDASLRIAERVDAGLPLWQAYGREPRLPGALEPFLRVGEERGMLPEALGNAAELMFGRLELRVQMLDRWAPVLISTLAALFITWLIMGVLTPMLGLIRGLSGGFGSGASVPEPTIDMFHWLVLGLPGVAVLIARRMLKKRGGSVVGTQMDQMLAAVSWSLLTAAGIGLVVGVSGGVVMIPAVIVLYLTLDAFIFMRRAEHRAMLWTLASAGARDLPFPEALRALADENYGALRPYALRLAEGLERGQPLDLAAKRARLWLPRELRVALAWAGRTGLVDAALRQALTTERASSREFRRIVNVFGYLWLVTLVMWGVLTFIMLKIVPVFARMFEEFELKIPAVTLLLIEISKLFVSGPGLLLFILLWVIMLGGGLLILDVNLGFFAQWIPPFSWFIRRYWGAHLLQLLAAAVRRGFSWNAALQAVTEAHPFRFVRTRLQRVARDVEQGQSPWLALMRQGLIARPEAAVLTAAERAGNLAWALDEMADSTLRRQVYWLRGWYNLALPVCVGVLGICVGYIVVALFMPLPALVQGLAPR